MCTPMAPKDLRSGPQEGRILFCVDERTADNLYYSAQTEWSDGSKSDVLYVPKNEVTDMLPPILIEVQNRVDQGFMSRLIHYCTYVYDRYNTLPVVLVVVIKGFSSISFEQQFNLNANRSYQFEMNGQCWAQSCNFLSAKSISLHLQQVDPMDPLVALAYYLTCPPQSSKSLANSTDQTVKTINEIMNKMITKRGMIKDRRIAMNDFFEQTELKLQKSIELDETEPEKSNMYVKEVLESIRKEKRKLEDDEPEPQEGRGNIPYTSDDYLFIETISKPGKKQKLESHL